MNMTKEQQIEKIKEYKKYPDKFVEEIIGVKLHWYQKLLLRCKLCCPHMYLMTGYREEQEAGIRYSMRRYECQKCGKVIWVDGRHDKYRR